MSQRSRRPSPAFVLALLALLVALGGSAAAGVPARIAKAISGRSIRNHSISGVKLRNNTLTGKQIAERKLGTVPRAARAVSAGNALSAGSVGGVTMRRISFVPHAGTGSSQIISLNGLNVFASCSPTGAPGLRVQSGVHGGDLRATVIKSPKEIHTGSDQNFDIPQTFDATRGASSGNGTLQFINKLNGQMVSLSYTFHGGSKTAPCVFGGVAFAG